MFNFINSDMKNLRKLILWTILKNLILVSSVNFCFSQDLAVGITGQTTLTGWENPVTLLNQESVQKAVLAIAEESLNREEFAVIIKDEPFGVDALIDSWILDERKGKLYINFNLVTEADGPVLKRIRDKHGQILAKEFIKRWDKIETAMNMYDLETVPEEVLAYILIGAFSLDWDGLGLTVEEGWMSLIPVLDERDVDMIRTLLLAGREAMLAWGEDNMDQVFSDMEKLVAVQQGVEPEVMMTKVWHHIFAGANTALIEEGLLADPYQRPKEFQDFFPVVWDIKNNPDMLVGSGSPKVNY